MGWPLSDGFELPYTRGMHGFGPQLTLPLLHDLQENIRMGHIRLLYAA
jgi:hypothetical protein